MKQNTPFLNFNTALLKGSLFATILYVLSPVASSYAQSANSQASTLLEVQALRQEVAQLRDMVERQQYELRKMQRTLQQDKVAVINEPSNTEPSRDSLLATSLPSVISEPTKHNVLGSELTSEVPTKINSSGAIDASVVPSLSVNEQITPVITQTEQQISSQTNNQPTGRTYPPVVEIEVGKPSQKTATQSISALQQSDTLVQTSSDAEVLGRIEKPIAVAKTQTQGLVEQHVPTSIVERGGISISDIKPIETIDAGPIVSIPALSSPNQAGAGAGAVVAPAQPFNVISERDYYQQAFGLLKESKHAEAVTVFQQQIKSYPKGELADDAYYWVAESMYVNRKLSIAKENYKAIVQGYPNSERLPDAMLKLAYIEQEQGNIIESRILLQEIVQFHPKSDAALSAKNRLSELN